MDWLKRNPATASVLRQRGMVSNPAGNATRPIDTIQMRSSSPGGPYPFADDAAIGFLDKHRFAQKVPQALPGLSTTPLPPHSGLFKTEADANAAIARMISLNAPLNKLLDSDLFTRLVLLASDPRVGATAAMALTPYLLLWAPNRMEAERAQRTRRPR